MKVLKVAEILPLIETSTNKKNNEKSQIIEIRNAMHEVINMDDALKGDIGTSIKDHFNRLHIPVILLFNHFLKEYNKTLQKVSDLTKEYETEQALVRQIFIEDDVKRGLEKVETMAEESVRIINDAYFKVSDLVSSSPISMSQLLLQLNQAHEHNEKTTKDLIELDDNASKLLKTSQEELQKIAGLVQKVAQWSAGGKIFDASTVSEIEKYLDNNSTLKKMIEDAVETSIKDNDSTITGDVGDLLGVLSQLNGMTSVGKGTLTATILLNKIIEFKKDGKGNFTVAVRSDWRQKNGKYASKMATLIHKALKTAGKLPGGYAAKLVSKYNNSPGRLLRELIGLKAGTTVKSYIGVLRESLTFLDFKKDAAKQYKKFPIDVKATLKQFTTTEGVKKIVTKIPFAGILFSVVMNGGETISDKHKYKSDWEKGGRAAAGIGMDVGVAGLTTGGAVIGSLICPGPGTIIGGAIGAAAGITASIIMEDKVKEVGEKAGKWVGDQAKKIGDQVEKVGDSISDGVKSGLSKTQQFVTGLFN